ncbi:MAG: hypothetical protein A7316_03540 [Candidatus Altiarchaeales archaeon WOR_SM1_86-2]|nr:MAG: hypothetical protein A7316_03540 [Candidatus Altiarchaeales archaeon WOR_SM1_86-2]
MGRRGYRPRKTNKTHPIKPRRFVVIVCEGAKTETQYFNGFNERNSGVKIVPLYENCNGPKSIVESAEKQIDKYDLNLDEGDGLWCAFDVDENTNDMIAYAVKIADENNIRIALSNPCIELWFLLHYPWSYNWTLTRKEAFKELKGFIKDYDKNYPEIYSMLKDKLPTAIENAKKLDRIHEKNNIKLISVESTPSSQVFKLIESIQELKRSKN